MEVGCRGELVDGDCLQTARTLTKAYGTDTEQSGEENQGVLCCFVREVVNVVKTGEL
jgi:hypothetical protein